VSEKREERREREKGEGEETGERSLLSRSSTSFNHPLGKGGSVTLQGGVVKASPEKGSFLKTSS
jgi:hypothetical protein